MLETKLYTALSGSTLITAQTGNRIYPVIMPQEVDLPAICYQRLSGGQINSLSGYLNLENPLIQIDVYSTSYSGAKELADNVHSVLNAVTTFKANVSGEQDMYEETIKAYRVSMNFSCWNRE